MKTVIKMAEEVGATHYWHLSRLEAFAELVRTDEREACAKVADSMDPLQDGAIGAAIRSRSQK